MSLGAAALLVITPFYHEITYTMPLVLSWWNWYSRVFFLKFIATYTLVMYLAHYLQSGLGSFHWRKSLAIIVIINIFLSYLLYTHFLMSFFESYYNNVIKFDLVNKFALHLEQEVSNLIKKQVEPLTLDQILDKILEKGIDNLTDNEKQKLDEYSKS